MIDYKLKLDVFEGPLELLMHLIDKNKLNIYDIPIAEVTEQYMAYIKAWEEFNLDLASEFLLMAASLLLIKSKMLLPRIPKDEDEEDTQDPREELIARLLEYKKYRSAADTLAEKLQVQTQFMTRQPTVIKVKPAIPQGNLEGLLQAFAGLWESFSPEPTVILREDFSVQDKMYDMVTLLHTKGRIEFGETINRSRSKLEMLASFLALLELLRLKRIAIFQDSLFGPIYVALVGK